VLAAIAYDCSYRCSRSAILAIGAVCWTDLVSSSRSAPASLGSACSTTGGFSRSGLRSRHALDGGDTGSLALAGIRWSGSLGVSPPPARAVSLSIPLQVLGAMADHRDCDGIGHPHATAAFPSRLFSGRSSMSGNWSAYRAAVVMGGHER
jgi:hypothetical protein